MYYEEIRECEHCKKETKHQCKDSEHERDSTGDYQECLECFYWKTGYNWDKLEPPLTLDSIS